MIDCRLVLSDVDGTLAYERSVVSEENRKWVAKLVNEKHIPFAIASGRMRSGVASIARQIPAPVILCAFNGGYIEVDGKPIHQEFVDYDVAKQVVRISHSLGVECVLFDLDDWYAEKGGKLYDIQTAFYDFEGHAVDLEQTIDQWKESGHPLYKCIPKTQDEKLSLKVRDALREALGDRLSIYNSSPFVVEAVNKGVNKACVVRTLCDYFHISPSQVMAFGDYDNDIQMLQASGWGIAMGNGLESVKNVAKYVTDTNKNDGVAKGIRKFFFEE